MEAIEKDVVIGSKEETYVPTEALIIIKVKRTDKGLNVFLKSEKIEKFMRSNHVHQDKLDSTNKRDFECVDVAGWKENMAYILSNEVKGISGNINKNWGADLHFGSGGPNLSFLRAKGLGEGVNFDLHGIYSQTAIQKWIQDAKFHITNFYREFLKDSEMCLHISLTEVQ